MTDVAGRAAGLLADLTPEWLMESEQRVCGAAIQSTEAAEKLGDIVRPGQMRFPAHQIVFGVACLLAEGGEPVDPTTVLAELTRRGEVGRMGGGPYLHTCMAWSVSEADHHARKVAADARRRELAETAVRIVQLAEQPGFDHDRDYDRAHDWMQQVTLPPGLGGNARTLPEITWDVLEVLDQGAMMGLPTGLVDLTELICGLSAGELAIIAARPGIGKSVLLATIARHIAKAMPGLGVLFMSLEMAAEQIVMRMLSGEARVPLHEMRSGHRVGEEYWGKLNKAGTAFADMPNLVIDYAPGCSQSHIRARMRGMQRTTPCGLLIVDYIQLMGDPPGARSRQEAVSGNARGLKDLSGEFGIPVVAAAQLNRNPESRADKKPQLADLRETGELEQAPDVVILLHREDAYDPESKRAGEIDLIVAKHRNGPTGIVTAAFQGHYGQIKDMAKGFDRPAGVPETDSRGQPVDDVPVRPASAWRDERPADEDAPYYVQNSG
jgi:replicative DNA helicase